MFSVNPDAHSISEIDLTRWGIAMARKGGLQKEHILNCHERDALERHLERRRR
jgi:DNA polymerase (family 10)